jgi:hypothetical protein
VSAAEEGWVELTCASAYHATGLEKEESRKLIETVLEAELGRRTRLQLKCDAPADVAESAEGKPGQDRTKEFEEISRKEPLVQKTLEMFGGQIVDIISKPATGGNK